MKMRYSAAWTSVIFCVWANSIVGFAHAHDGQQTLYWCASFDCIEPISEGKTNLNYQAPDRDQLTFGRNQEVTILSKPVHANKGHWIGRIRGKIGMIPVNMVKETKMYGKLEHGYQYPLDTHPLQPKEKSVNVEDETPKLEIESKETKNLDVIDGTPNDSGKPEAPAASPNDISPTSANLDTSESEVLLQPSQTIDTTDDVPESKSEDTSHLLSSQPVTPVLTDNPSVVFTSEKTDLPLDEDSSSKSAANIEATPPVPPSKESTEPTEAPVINLHPSPSPFSEVYDSIQTFFGGTSTEDEKVEEVVQSVDSVPAPEVATNSVEKDESDVREKDSQHQHDSHNHEHSQQDNHNHQHGHHEHGLHDHSNHEHGHQDHPNHEHGHHDHPNHEHGHHDHPNHEHSHQDHPNNENGPHEATEDAIPVQIDPQDELQRKELANVETPNPEVESKEPKHLDIIDGTPINAGNLEVPDASPNDISSTYLDASKSDVLVEPAQSIDDVPEFNSEDASDLVSSQPVTPVVTDNPSVVLTSDKTDLPLEKDSSSESAVNIETAPPVSTSKESTDPIEAPVINVDTPHILEQEKPEVEQPDHTHHNLLLPHGNGHEVHSQHHTENVKLTEDEVPSFATEDPIQTQIDAQEELQPISQPAEAGVEKQKIDLVGRHEHLNPLLHRHSDSEDHDHEEGHHHHHHEHKTAAETSSFVLAIQHLSSTLINFLPEYLQDTILDVNDALVFTGIIALTLVSICVPYFFIETFLSVRPLKKKVTELNKNLWKVSTAYENQQEEYDVFKKKALAYDEDKKRIEQLELELHLIKKLESKQKDQIRQLQKELKSSAKVASEVESLVESTMDERNKAVEERDKLKAVVVSLQSSLKETTEELESAQADVTTTQMDLDLITHTKENLDLKVKAIEKEMLELKQKVLTEVDLRRSLQLEKDKLGEEKDSFQEELADLKGILHKYEETVNDLNQELSLKENELTVLKETLGDDSPLIDIAEMTARLQGAESQAKSLQSRVESITLENTSLSRNYEQTKATVKTLQTEKDQAETRLQVLESYFKEKEEELRTIVEKYEVEKNIRGKDKDELVSMIEEKNDEVKDLSTRLEKLKEEFEQTKLGHRNEIRALEAKSHENWLSLCQSERKAQDVRKESELLRQKLTAIAKGKEAEANDARSSNGDVLAPFLFSQLELDEIPVPIMPDESILPSYFGLGEGFYGLGDFEPPAPLDDDDEEDGEDTLNSIQRREREPHRPPPLGRISPTYSDNEPDMSPIIMPRGGREDYSDGSSSPAHNRPTSRGNWMNGNQSQSTPTRRRGPQTSSPIQHGLNL